jgi:hypothetical protein
MVKWLPTCKSYVRISQQSYTEDDKGLKASASGSVHSWLDEYHEVAMTVIKMELKDLAVLVFLIPCMLKNRTLEEIIAISGMACIDDVGLY